MDQDDFNDALYAGAHSTMKTAQYSERGPVVPSDAQINKFRVQLKRFLEACQEHIMVADLLELFP